MCSKTRENISRLRKLIDDERKRLQQVVPTHHLAPIPKPQTPKPQTPASKPQTLSSPALSP